MKILWVVFAFIALTTVACVAKDTEQVRGGNGQRHDIQPRSSHDQDTTRPRFSGSVFLYGYSAPGLFLYFGTPYYPPNPYNPGYNPYYPQYNPYYRYPIYGW
jgi:hypothetical protein